MWHFYPILILLQKRHVSDYQINNRHVTVLSGTGYVLVICRELKWTRPGVMTERICCLPITHTMKYCTNKIQFYGANNPV